jgi:hypothetical protein
MRRGKPRLPWKRGPAAWKIKQDADEIKIRLGAEKRNFFSLRKTARLLSVSTQPIRDWIRLGYLKREGPRGQIAKGALERFIGWLEEHAEFFDPLNYLERIPPKFPFQKLSSSHFVWPKGHDNLKPSELAAIINCHPSLIVKAIRCGRLHMHHQTGCHCKISKRTWRNSFPLTFDLPSN